jgi:hypothetical protein
MLAPKGLGLDARQRLERALVGIVVEAAPGKCATVAAGHRVESRARHGDFQHSPRLYV